MKHNNIVIISSVGRAGHNVLRAARQFSTDIYLVHDKGARSLRYAAGVKVLHAVRDFRAMRPKDLAEKINDLHDRVGVTAVVSTDVPSALALATARDLLRAPVYPVPDVRTLLRLNDKALFTQLCQELGIPVPRTLHFLNGGLIDAELIGEQVGYPAILKPVDAFGQTGIVIVRNKAEAVQVQKEAVADRRYRHGLVAQEYVQGQDWSASVIAKDGVIRFAVQWRAPSPLDRSFGKARFTETAFAFDEDLDEFVERIIKHTNYSGTCNFDARRTPDGRFVLFECNPRFSGRIVGIRLCGLDLLRVAITGEDAIQPVAGIYMPWHGLLTRRGWHGLLNGDWRWRVLLADCAELLRDPLPTLARRWFREP